MPAIDDFNLASSSVRLKAFAKMFSCTMSKIFLSGGKYLITVIMFKCAGKKITIKINYVKAVMADV